MVSFFLFFFFFEYEQVYELNHDFLVEEEAETRDGVEKSGWERSLKGGGGGEKEGRTYFANALARAFLQLTFCAPTKLSTVTAMARSTSCGVQYSDRRILQKDSLIRKIASRWRTCASSACFEVSPGPRPRKSGIRCANV